MMRAPSTLPSMTTIGRQRPGGASARTGQRLRGNGTQRAMRFPGDPTEVAESLVSAWSGGGPGDDDPFLRAIRHLREASAYHHRFGGDAAAAAFKESADLFEAILRRMQDMEVTYDEAAALGPWARGTVKNKKAGLHESARGTVRLSDLPLNPSDALAGLRSRRVTQLIEAERAKSEGEARAQNAKSDEDEVWAQAQIHSMSQ